MNKKSKRLAVCGVISAAAILLSYVEFLIPINLGIPGVKLGLANMMFLLLLELVSAKEAVTVNYVRVFVSALLFGSVSTLIYSFAGATVSMILMCAVFNRHRLSIFGISLIGAVSHNIAQICIAVLVTKTSLLFGYLPVLIISGVVSGIAIAFLTTLISKKLPLSADFVDL